MRPDTIVQTGAMLLASYTGDFIGRAAGVVTSSHSFDEKKKKFKTAY